ncbi:MAG: hypothetical protein HKN11_12545 [Rhizobiales bacterium]|nr:hypothetical protein [Hyphomicrobiales bacterium]
MKAVLSVIMFSLGLIVLGGDRPAQAGDVDDCNNAYTMTDVEACSRILKSGKLNGRRLTDELKAIVLYKRGKARSTNGKYKAAVKDLKKSLQLNPNDPEAKDALALARQQLRSAKSISSASAPKNTKKLSEWERAAAVLKKRGFSAKQAFAVLKSFGCGYYSTECRVEAFGEHNLNNLPLIVAARYSLSRKTADDSQYWNSDISRGDIVYDVQSGAYLGGMRPSRAARSISRCYKSKKFFKSCKLRYHQKDGCRLTKKWVKLCRKGTNDPVSGELCYWDIKGDLPVLPSAKATKSRIALNDAKRQTKVAAVVPKKKKAKLPKWPYCTHEQLSQ